MQGVYCVGDVSQYGLDKKDIKKTVSRSFKALKKLGVDLPKGIEKAAVINARPGTWEGNIGTFGIVKTAFGVFYNQGPYIEVFVDKAEKKGRTKEGTLAQMQNTLIHEIVHALQYSKLFEEELADAKAYVESFGEISDTLSKHYGIIEADLQLAEEMAEACDPAMLRLLKRNIADVAEKVHHVFNKAVREYLKKGRADELKNKLAEFYDLIMDWRLKRQAFYDDVADYTLSLMDRLEIPRGHYTYFIVDVMNQVFASGGKDFYDNRGRRTYHPFHPQGIEKPPAEMLNRFVKERIKEYGRGVGPLKEAKRATDPSRLLSTILKVEEDEKDGEKWGFYAGTTEAVAHYAAEVAGRGWDNSKFAGISYSLESYPEKYRSSYKSTLNFIRGLHEQLTGEYGLGHLEAAKKIVPAMLEAKTWDDLPAVKESILRLGI